MRIYTKALLVLLLTGFLAACVPDTPTPVEAPLETVLTVQLTPALDHWLPTLSSCAHASPSAGIIVDIQPREKLTLQEADVILRLGEKQESDPHTAVMGWEELVVFVGPDVPLASLSQVSLQKIFSGDITRWETVAEIQSADVQISQSITVWSYPSGNEIRELFEEAYLLGEAITPAARPFSTPEFLQENFPSTSYGITYSLKVHSDNDVLNQLDITGADIVIQHYVLAITQEEPEGALRQLLLCLQESP
jgi:hypothetical protein